MYYEEKVIDGVLCRRHDPNDPWEPFTLEQVLAKYLESERARLFYANKINELVGTLAYAHETMQEVVQHLPDLGGVSISVLKWYHADKMVREAIERSGVTKPT